MKNITMKRSLAVIMSLTMAMGLAGCAENASITTSQNGVNAESNVNLIENKDFTEEKIDVEVKKDEKHLETTYEITDWTLDNLSENITLCGERISLPCGVSEMKNFSFSDPDNGDGSSQYISSARALFYNDEEVAVVGFANEKASNNYDNAKISTLILRRNNGELPTFNIMGITEKSTRDDIVKILGEPNYMKNDEEGRVYRYLFSDNSAFMIIFEKDNVDVINAVFIMAN